MPEKNCNDCKQRPVCALLYQIKAAEQGDYGETVDRILLAKFCKHFEGDS